MAPGVEFTCRQDGVQDVAEVRCSDSQQGALGDGICGVLEVSAEVGSGHNAGAGGEVDGEDGEERVQVTWIQCYKTFYVRKLGW